MIKKVFRTLQSALTAFGMPPENHDLIDRITQSIPIEQYEVVWRDSGTRRDHILAIRSDHAQPDLHIHSGWTDGFVSEAEALEATGRKAVQSECRGQGFYSVVHRMAGVRGGERSSRRPTRAYGYCDTCRYELLPTGACDKRD